MTKQNHNFELVFKEHLHFHESLYLLNIRGMFLKNFIVKIPPFFDPERLQSVYDALRKMAHNIKKRAKYCINIILSIYFEQIFHKLIKEL